MGVVECEGVVLVESGVWGRWGWSVRVWGCGVGVGVVG